MTASPYMRLGLTVLLMAGAATALAQQVTVRAAVEKTDAYVGEPFMFQIQVQGSDRPEEPDIAGLTQDFDVQPLGGQTNNSQSVSIVNGRVTSNVQRAYIYSYRLTPKKAGLLTIPALAVTAEGQRFTTQPIQLNGRTPQETAEFKLRLALSSEKCYVGQPVVLAVTWYLGKDVRHFAFTVPVLQDARFVVEDLGEPQNPGKEYYKVQAGDMECIAEKGQEALDNISYTTLSFKKVLIPKQTGTIDIQPATVACEGKVSEQRRGSRGFFDDFFGNDPFFGSRGTFKNFVTPSNALRLEVAELPQQGRPANFSGLLGTFTITASATPTEVNVGDPITLTVRISGSPYLKAVELPPLEAQPELAKQFKIPKEMAPGKIEGNAKVFTQTIRAQDASVNAIPPITLNYFNSDTGTYQETRSRPIPLKVHESRVVTAAQAEGVEVQHVRNQLTQWREGIAHNYEDLNVLTSQAFDPGYWVRSPLWLTILLLPPLAYAVLVGIVLTRRKGLANPELRRARRAHAEAAHRLKAIDAANAGRACEETLNALREYLGAKLRVAGTALTYEDARRLLEQKQATPEIQAQLKEIFRQCEAYSYAGQSSGQNAAGLIEQTLAIIQALEKGVLR